MGFFENNDQFEDIVREFLGGGNSRIRRGNYEEIIEGEEEEREMILSV